MRFHGIPSAIAAKITAAVVGAGPFVGFARLRTVDYNSEGAKATIDLKVEEEIGELTPGNESKRAPVTRKQIDEVLDMLNVFPRSGIVPEDVLIALSRILTEVGRLQEQVNQLEDATYIQAVETSAGNVRHWVEETERRLKKYM